MEEQVISQMEEYLEWDDWYDAMSLKSIRLKRRREEQDSFTYQRDERRFSPNLTSITIPTYFTSIGDEPFREYRQLTNIVIPPSVTKIGEGAFMDCSSLTTIVIPSTVMLIDERAFYRCTSLTNIVIPPSVSSISEGMFFGCKSLTNIVIPSSVTKIANGAFCKCESLTNIVIPPSVTSIGEEAFCQCYSLTSIVIPSSVTSIGDGAFYYCRSLTNIVIPPSVTSIGGNGLCFMNGTFQFCTSLTKIVIPPSVTSIENNAFQNCTSLTKIVIPPSVTKLGVNEREREFWGIDINTFGSCSSLKSIDVTVPPVLEECSEPNLFTEAIRVMTPNNMKEWVKTRAQDGRLPLCTAAAVSLKWEDIKRIFDANKIAIYERDVVTGLSAFMLAAVGINSDFESVYRLCREYPVAILH